MFIAANLTINQHRLLVGQRKSNRCSKYCKEFVERELTPGPLMHFQVEKLNDLLLFITQTRPDCGPADPGDRGEPTSKSS